MKNDVQKNSGDTGQVLNHTYKFSIEAMQSFQYDIVSLQCTIISQATEFSTTTRYPLPS